MLKSGVFKTPTAMYYTYEVEEKGFHRIDFLNQSAAFNVDVNAIVFSQVRRKNTYVYGDMAIFDEYCKAKATIENAKMRLEKDTEWIDGAYCSKELRTSRDGNYVIESIVKNGVLDTMTMSGDGFTIHSTVIDNIYDIKIDPINFRDYKPLTLTLDTIGEDNGKLFYDIETLRRRYDISHLDKMDYVVCTDILTFGARLKQFEEDPYPLRAVDTETTGLDVNMYGDDKLVGVILGTNKHTATYFPFRHTGDFNLPMQCLHAICEILRKMWERLVAHNTKFDRKVFLKEGEDVLIHWDTMQLSIVLNPVLGKGIHGLKYLTGELIHKTFLELSNIFVNEREIDFGVLPPEIILPYACPDGTSPLILIEDQFKKLPKHQRDLAEMECLLANMKADQEFYGIRVDLKKFERLFRNCNYVLELLLKAFRTLTKEDGNINSSQLLSNLIYNKMHCPVLLHTKTGAASTSAQAIKKLAKRKAKTVHTVVTEDLVDLEGKVIISAEELNKSAYPALVILAKYREYNKLKTAFFSRFERTMKTGRVFFWINQNGAATGRQSSPMHQLPHDLKECILADDNDRDFWGPDYSQVELRMIAYLAGEKELIELAKDPDNDIHRIIGSLISNKEMWAITPEERSTGKRRNFGVVYLISAMGLAGQIFGPGYTKEDVKFCQGQLDAFYHRFKRIDRFIKRNAKLVQEQGYMETAWFHRVRLFKEVFDPDIEPRRLASILRMGNNVPVQGTAADYLKLAEVKMFFKIREKGWNKLKNGFPLVRAMLSIHDEVIFSVDQSIPYEEIIELIVNTMETPVEGAPPFFVQPARMDNWAGHSDDACAMPIKYRDKVIEDYNKTHESVFKQSYFKVVVPTDIEEELNQRPMSIKEAVEKYSDRITLQFDHGNYTKEFNRDHVKDAFWKYVESGNSIYRIDNYITLLNNYRDLELEDYMNGLIKQYGLDGEKVGEHVRHPSLTHELLNKYNKQISYDLPHEQRITEAAKLYVADVKSGKINMVAEFKFVTTTLEFKPTDKEKFGSELEALVNLDVDGNVIYEESNAEEELDIYDLWDDDDPDAIIAHVSEKPKYVWELADVITADLQTFLREDIDEILRYVFQYHDDNGFYKFYIIYNGEMLDTKIKIENIDVEAFNDFVVSISERRNKIYATT